MLYLLPRLTPGYLRYPGWCCFSRPRAAVLGFRVQSAVRSTDHSIL